MSFNLGDLLSNASNDIPKNYWLLNKSQGLSRYVPIEHAILNGDAVESTVEISGRKNTLSNSLVYTHL
jgi:hypothetical protein